LAAYKVVDYCFSIISEILRFGKGEEMPETFTPVDNFCIVDKEALALFFI
jgi:hypothetical protein